MTRIVARCRDCGAEQTLWAAGHLELHEPVPPELVEALAHAHRCWNCGEDLNGSRVEIVDLPAEARPYERWA